MIQGHDHAVCVDTALCAAEAYCREHGLRLTELRRRVLELVWSSHRPVGAYSVLEQLAAEGRSAAPPTVYRALDFLLANGLVHRIASLNAYLGCNHPQEAHDAQFFICRRCGEAVELTNARVGEAIAGDATRLGFQMEAQTVEISGLCSHCLGEQMA